MPSEVNTKDAGTAPGGNSAPAKTAKNPVAIELPVSVTGAKPTGGAERELFSEETCTVLVFKDGAVIRLNAGVTVGQLLFLTEKKSKREVVCQVVQKRAFRPTSCYVEVEFTEAMNDFWGVTFPEEAVDGSTPKVAMEIEAEEATEDNPVEAPPAPKSEDVQALKTEVEALRAQLQEILKAKEAEEKRLEIERKLAEENRAALQAEIAAVEKGNAEREEEARKRREKQEAPPVRAMKLPDGNAAEKTSAEAQSTQRSAEEEKEESMEELLPQPALDFSQGPTIAKASGTKAGSGLARVAIAAGVVLVLAGGGAWYENLLPFAPRGKKAEAVVGMKRAPVEAAVSGGAKSGGEGTVGVPAAGNGKSGDGAASGAVDGEKKEEAKTGAVEAGSAAVGAEKTETVNAAEAKPEEARRKVTPARVNKAEAVENVTGEKAVEADAGVADGTVVAPKLLKAVSPVYPVDAMEKYITGDVSVEAMVLANGKVGKAEAVSGPAALRAAAVEAVKQYQYAPGTQGGKAVAPNPAPSLKP